MASERVHLFWEILLAIIIPPLGVCLKYGCCSCKFFICLVLTLLGYIPGIIYAICVIVMGRDHHRLPAEGHYLPVDHGPGPPAHHAPTGHYVVPVSHSTHGHGHGHAHGHGHGH